MMKNLILAFSSFFIILTSFQNVFGQNSLTLIGKVIDYKTSEHITGVKIEAYSGKVLLNKTDTNFEDGYFTLSVINPTDKVVFSFSNYYPIIIENINNTEGNELNLETIKLFEIPIVFTRYISKKAEREGRKESRRKFKKLKEGIIINTINRNYKMRLKRKKGELGFYIDFKDFKNN